ncbi:hypothetical protein D3C75_825810 [compost metagenome]
MLVLGHVQPAAIAEFNQQGRGIPQRGVAKRGQAVEHRVYGVAACHTVVAVEAADETGGVRRTQCRVDGGRDAGQRHVVAIVQIETDTHTGDVFRKAQAVDVDVIDVELVVAAGIARSQLSRADRHRLQHQVRQDVRGLAIVETQGAVEPRRTPLGHETEVTLLVRGMGVAIGQAQKLIDTQRPWSAETGIACSDQRQVVAAVLDTIVEAQVRARLRQPCSIPIEKVLRCQGQLRVDCEAGGQLVARDEQLFGFSPWHRKRLGQIQTGLAITVAVGEGQHAFTPIQGVLTSLAAQ